MFEGIDETEAAELLFMTGVMTCMRPKIADLGFDSDTLDALCIYAGVAAKDAMHIFGTEANPLDALDQIRDMERLYENDDSPNRGTAAH